MNNNTCYNCGGAYIARGGRLVCASCGTVHPEGLSHREWLLLEQAHQRLRSRDFIGAQQIFGDIMRQYPRNAQAYFGRLLAKYRVNYEEDTDGVRFPFCCSSLTESVTESSYYKKALEYADPLTLGVYRRHASYIEHCRLDRIAEAEARKADLAALAEAEKSMAQKTNSAPKEPMVSQGLAYKVIDSMSCAVTGMGTCTDKEIVIPEKIDGRRVTAIRDAFLGCTTLTSVVIPASVTSIGQNAFLGCTSLVSIKIPNSVTSIGDSAFSGCTSLADVEIPNSVTSIDNWAFRSCKGLTSVVIPASVTSIGTWAFLDCKGLMSVDIPNSVTSIGTRAFSGCTSLSDVKFRTSATNRDNVTSRGSKNLVKKANTTSVVSIGEYAFSGCTSLASVEIPNSVRSIGKSAFFGCKSLASVSIPDSVTSIGDHAFSGCTSLANVTIPDSVTEISHDAFRGCLRLTSVVIPVSVTDIKGEVFSHCTSLTTLRYTGTKKQWKQISFAENWKEGSSIRSVECENGTIKL